MAEAKSKTIISCQWQQLHRVLRSRHGSSRAPCAPVLPDCSSFNPSMFLCLLSCTLRPSSRAKVAASDNELAIPGRYPYQRSSDCSLYGFGCQSLRLFHYLKSLFYIKDHQDRDSSRSSQVKRSEDAPAPVHFQLRTIYVESWARVTTFSLSGKLLLPFADRFLVQWPDLAGKQAWRGMRETEYAGTLVD